MTVVIKELKYVDGSCDLIIKDKIIIHIFFYLVVKSEGEREEARQEFPEQEDHTYRLDEEEEGPKVQDDRNVDDYVEIP